MRSNAKMSARIPNRHLRPPYRAGNSRLCSRNSGLQHERAIRSTADMIMNSPRDRRFDHHIQACTD